MDAWLCGKRRNRKTSKIHFVWYCRTCGNSFVTERKDVLPTIEKPDEKVLEYFSINKQALISGGQGTDLQCQGHVLVAEDYPLNQDLVKIHLRTAGYTVDLVENGEQAVAACNEQEYDLILMDVQMPIMNGYDAAKLILADSSRCSKVPIVALTASADKETRKACIDAGMIKVITKPIIRKDFLETVRSLIGIPAGKTKEEETEDTDTETDQVKINFGQLLEYDNLVDEFSGDKKTVNGLIERFIKSVEEQLLLLAGAIKNKDAAVVRHQTHKIRGGAASLRAMSLAEAAERLEMVAKAGEMETAELPLLKLENEFLKLQMLQDRRNLQKH